MLEQAVSRVFMVASSDLWSQTRGRPRVAFARQVAMYLAHVAWGLSLTEVGLVFARDRTTVAHACGLVEDCRDDPMLDRSLELLERALRSYSPFPFPSPSTISSERGMSSANVGAARAATEKDALLALRRLAAKGAYAVPDGAAPGAGGDFSILSARDGNSQPLATITAAAFAWARRNSWIESEPGTGRYRISADGVKALRRASSGPAALAPTAGLKNSGGRKAKSKAETAIGGAREGSLAWLRRRRDKDGQSLITEPQFAAGERLGADFWHAQLSPRVTADWSAAASSRRGPRPAPGVGVEIGDHVVAARQRVHRALDAVGPELAGILVEVCCREVGLETAERALGLPQRSAKTVLQLALTRLARHYGLIPPPPRPGTDRLRHWGSEDYRPHLDSWR